MLEALINLFESWGVNRAADQLESLTAADRWPFPTYSDLLFSV